MRKILAFALLCALLLALAPARADGFYPYTAYVNNAVITDRLHLRESPDTGSRSLGKYYNGTPVYVTGKVNNDWVKVRIGNENVNYNGYMMSRYLVTSLDFSFINAMPLYISTANKWTVYQKPSANAPKQTLGKGLRVYMMGFTGDWWHILVPTGGSEGDLHCFVPAGASTLALCTRVYISNPVKTDRLHLRVEPDKNYRSLGKYYNGSEATLLGQSMDREWCYVDLYGRKGWMTSRYLCFEGEVNTTYYGIVEAKAITKTALRSTPSADGKRIATIDNGTRFEVFGVLEDWLHIRKDGGMGFVLKSATDFVD